MARQEGTFKIPANIEPRAAAPLDARQTVATLADLTTSGTFSYPYEGMPVYVKSEHKYYIYKGGGVTTSSNWEVFGSGGSGFETLFKATTSLFSKEVGGVTQLSSISSIKHAYDSTSSISENDLINNVSLVLDVDSTLVVYLGKNNQNKYLFKTVQIGIICEYDESADEFYITAPGGVIWTKSDIIPADSGTVLGAYGNRFNTLYTLDVDASRYVAASRFNATRGESDPEPQINLRTDYDDGTSHVLKFSSASDIFATREFYDENSEFDHEYLYKLPNAGGTLALTSNIPSSLDGIPDGSTRKLANYLPLAGGTLTGGLNVKSGVGISDASGNGMLVYHPSSWTGVSSSQWGVGAVDSQAVIRSSAADLIHYRGSAAYTIYDSYNFLTYHTGRNNEANKLVRTDGSGYIQAGWINTTSGDMSTTAMDRIYCSNDGYIRYKSITNFMKGLGFAQGNSFVVFVLYFAIGTGSITGESITNIYGSTSISSKSTGYNTSGSEKPSTTYGLWFKLSASHKYFGCRIGGTSGNERVGNGNGTNRTSGLMAYSTSSTQYLCLGTQQGGNFLIIGY